MNLAAILPDILLVVLLGGIPAMLLVLARSRLPDDKQTLVEAINRILPQTQCAQCSYPGCRPYAEAIATGEAINRCPPGGESTITQLAELLGREILPLDDSLVPAPPDAKVRIREEECIGCTLCIAACPVDAIIGAAQEMHTVIASICTGCELCIEPCPVDCIDLLSSDAREPDLALLDHPSDNACINCGECALACPRDLQPQLLYWYRSDMGMADQLDLERCIECRRCDRICPSELPLTPVFQASKMLHAEQREKQREAVAAEERYIARQSRISQAQTAVVARPSTNDRQALLAAIRDDQ